MSVITRSKLCDQVGQHLMEEIVAGGFDLDRPMPTESDLSERFGVSRSAIREGIKMLSVRGLVSVRQGAGTFVTGPEHWKVVDPALLRAMGKGKMLSQLVEARMEIEPVFARVAATEATSEELAALGVAISNEEQIVNFDEAVRCDRLFHRGITQATHNYVFLVMMDSLNILMDESRHLLVKTGKTEVARSVEDHRAIFGALINRDAPAAEAAMREHLLHVGQQLAMLQVNAAHLLGPNSGEVLA